MSHFKHPLARDAKIWATGGSAGTPQRLLVIVTTMELDSAHKGYKPDNITKLSEAARTWVKDHSLEASDFLLISRPKEWN